MRPFFKACARNSLATPTAFSGPSMIVMTLEESMDYMNRKESVLYRIALLSEAVDMVKNGDTLDRAINEFGPERFIALSKDTNPLSDTTNYNPPNDYTFGEEGIKVNKPGLPNPSLPKIPPPTSLARRGSAFNVVPVQGPIDFVRN